MTAKKTGYPKKKKKKTGKKKMFHSTFKVI